MRISRFLRTRPVLAAFIMLGIAAVIGVLLSYKNDLITALTPGETVTVQLAENYRMTANDTEVKIAGSPVGKVQSIEQEENGPVTVTLKVAHGTRKLLGTEPSATIRPVTILGGKYYIELTTGGQPGEFTGTIPPERAKLPVELDKVLAAIPPEAQKGLQGMTERLDTTLKAGLGGELKKLVKDAPDTLRPAGVVLDAARGVNKDGDLAALTTNADQLAKVLSAKPGQLRAVVDSLANTSNTLGANSGPLARTIADLPDTLRSTRRGAADLNTTLDKLIDTADDARPAVRELDPTLKRLEPVLEDLRPLASDLREVLHEARPLLDKLVPTVRKGIEVLDDIQGRPLDTVNGPILKELNSEFKGEGPKYTNGGRTGSKFYQELMYLLTNTNGLTQYSDGTAHMLGFEFAGSSSTVLGHGTAAESFERMLHSMFGLPSQGPDGGSKNPPIIPGTGQGFRVPAPDPGVSPPVVDPNGLLGKGPGK